MGDTLPWPSDCVLGVCAMARDTMELTSAEGCKWVEVGCSLDWSLRAMGDVTVSFPVDVSPDCHMASPGTCNAICTFDVSVEVWCASCFGGCSTASEPS